MHMIVFRLKVLMAERDISNKKLAEELGVDPRVISRWRQPKKYKPIKLDVSYLNEMCRVLDCQPGDLLKYEPDPN